MRHPHRRNGFSLVEPERNDVPAQAGIYLQRAFSLVELSIVLVILGLLVGGVLSGQSLIRASELRSLASDLARYQTAVYTFRDKYFALPGDMTNATTFWGVRASTGSDATCHQTINSTTGTCNGDGNGSIDFIAGDATAGGERFAGWQHLARAGLVEGNYTGASGSASSYVTLAGTNCPRTKMSDGLIRLAWIGGPVSGHANLFDGPYSFNLLELGSTSGPALKPEEMWNIDTKMDDGRPATGNILVPKNTSTWAPGCATTDVASTATYSLTSTSKLCLGWMAFR